MTKLYVHQQKLLDANPARHLLCWSTGTGKTLAAISLAKKNGVKTLVICPKIVKENWQRQCGFHGLKNSKVVSKEEFRRDWDTMTEYQAVIVDEAHWFASLSSQMSKALHNYCKRWDVKYRWFLTATPILKDAWNLFALATRLGYKLDYWGFRRKFFADVRMGARVVPVMRKGIEPELARIVAQIGSVVKFEECVDMPEQLFRTEVLGLSAAQSKAIRDLTDTEFISRWTKVHCLENGYLAPEEYQPESGLVLPNSPKFQRLRELVLEEPKVAIIARYNAQIDIIADQLADLGRPVFKIRGATKNRDQVIQDIEAALSAIVLIQADTCEGYELNSIGFIIFASMSFSLKNYVQAQGRFLRINRPKRNRFIHLISGEVDQAVYDCIMKKKDFSFNVLKNGKAT